MAILIVLVLKQAFLSTKQFSCQDRWAHCPTQIWERWFLVFAHTNIASQTGFVCFSRCSQHSYRERSTKTISIPTKNTVGQTLVNGTALYFSFRQWLYRFVNLSPSVGSTVDYSNFCRQTVSEVVIRIQAFQLGPYPCSTIILLDLRWCSAATYSFCFA